MRTDLNRDSVLKTLSLMAVLLLAFNSAGYAALVSGSEGRVNLTGNDASLATGSFSVDVAYEVYDGSSASDPLGANGSTQLVFALLHNGTGGESPVLAFSRFFVYAPAGSGNVTPFYTSVNYMNPIGAGTFLVGPSGNELDPYNGIIPHTSSGSVMSTVASPSNRARFSFTTAPANTSDFQPGQHSQMLVLTALPENFPANVTIEIDGTMTSPSIHADTTISLVPEPSGIMLALAAGAYALLRRPKARI